MAAKTAKSAQFLEVERKFDVTSTTIHPSFEGLSAVDRSEKSPPESLSATYFDTPERHLASHRITLRRRTGGADEGWHLKLPAGPDARTEHRAPLGEEGVVPDALRDVVLAIVRDKPLAPVAWINTERSIQVLYLADGTPLAEFCDDHVTASAHGDDAEQQWREWELELLEGGDRALLDRLTNRLRDAGAEVAAKGSKLARVLGDAPKRQKKSTSDPVHRAVSEQVDELIEWDRAVRADVYDSVHQMRVTTRKIRSLLQTSEASFGLIDNAWVLDELRQLAAVLGVARDAEVLAEKYEKTLGELPADLIRGPVRERLVDGAKQRYAAGLRRSHAAMRTTRYFRLLDALEALVASEPDGATDESGESEAPASSATVDTAYKKVRKAAKVAAHADDDHDEALHRIRKGAKRLRYTAAATGASKVAEAAKTVQTLLGDHQDSVVSRTHLGQQAASAHAAGEDTFTYGVLYQREDDIANDARTQLEEALQVLDKAVKKYH